jgi:ankyrin repeat protein
MQLEPALTFPITHTPPGRTILQHRLKIEYLGLPSEIHLGIFWAGVSGLSLGSALRFIKNFAATDTYHESLVVRNYETLISYLSAKFKISEIILALDLGYLSNIWFKYKPIWSRLRTEKKLSSILEFLHQENKLMINCSYHLIKCIANRFHQSEFKIAFGFGFLANQWFQKKRPFIPNFDQAKLTVLEKIWKCQGNKLLENESYRAFQLNNLKLGKTSPFLDLNFQDLCGNTLLFILTEKRDKANIKLILEHGADPDIENNKRETALQVAYENNFFDIAQLLIKHRADSKFLDNLPCDSDVDEVIKEDPLFKIPPYVLNQIIDARIDNPSKKIINDYLENWKQLGHNLLEFISKSDLGNVRNLLSNGADPNFVNKNGQTPLLVACSKPHCFQDLIIESLLSFGADPNVKDQIGCTPLIWACSTGSLLSIKSLIQNGASLEAVDALGITPLGKASLSGNYSAVEVLLNYQQQSCSPKLMNQLLNTTDFQGQTALILATQNGCQDIASLLIKSGADTRIKDNSGRVAADYTDNQYLRKLLGEEDFLNEEFDGSDLEDFNDVDVEKVNALKSDVTDHEKHKVVEKLKNYELGQLLILNDCLLSDTSAASLVVREMIGDEINRKMGI